MTTTTIMNDSITSSSISDEYNNNNNNEEKNRRCSIITTETTAQHDDHSKEEDEDNNNNDTNNNTNSTTTTNTEVDDNGNDDEIYVTIVKQNINLYTLVFVGIISCCMIYYSMIVLFDTFPLHQQHQQITSSSSSSYDYMNQNSNSNMTTTITASITHNMNLIPIYKYQSICGGNGVGMMMNMDNTPSSSSSSSSTSTSTSIPYIWHIIIENEISIITNLIHSFLLLVINLFVIIRNDLIWYYFNYYLYYFWFIISLCFIYIHIIQYYIQYRNDYNTSNTNISLYDSIQFCSILLFGICNYILWNNYYKKVYNQIRQVQQIQLQLQSVSSLSILCQTILSICCTILQYTILFYYIITTIQYSHILLNDKDTNTADCITTTTTIDMNMNDNNDNGQQHHRSLHDISDHNDESILILNNSNMNYNHTSNHINHNNHNSMMISNFIMTYSEVAHLVFIFGLIQLSIIYPNNSTCHLGTMIVSFYKFCICCIVLLHLLYNHHNNNHTRFIFSFIYTLIELITMIPILISVCYLYTISLSSSTTNINTTKSSIFNFFQSILYKLCTLLHIRTTSTNIQFTPLPNDHHNKHYTNKNHHHHHDNLSIDHTDSTTSSTSSYDDDDDDENDQNEKCDGDIHIKDGMMNMYSIQLGQPYKDVPVTRSIDEIKQHKNDANDENDDTIEDGIIRSNHNNNNNNIIVKPPTSSSSNYRNNNSDNNNNNIIEQFHCTTTYQIMMKQQLSHQSLQLNNNDYYYNQRQQYGAYLLSYSSYYLYIEMIIECILLQSQSILLYNNNMNMNSKYDIYKWGLHICIMYTFCTCMSMNDTIIYYYPIYIRPILFIACPIGTILAFYQLYILKVSLYTNDGTGSSSSIEKMDSITIIILFLFFIRGICGIIQTIGVFLLNTLQKQQASSSSSFIAANHQYQYKIGQQDDDDDDDDSDHNNNNNNNNNMDVETTNNDNDDIVEHCCIDIINNDENDDDDDDADDVDSNGNRIIINNNNHNDDVQQQLHSIRHRIHIILYYIFIPVMILYIFMSVYMNGNCLEPMISPTIPLLQNNDISSSSSSCTGTSHPKDHDFTSFMLMANIPGLGLYFHFGLVLLIFIYDSIQLRKPIYTPNLYIAMIACYNLSLLLCTDLLWDILQTQFYTSDRLLSIDIIQRIIQLIWSLSCGYLAYQLHSFWNLRVITK